jgi:hypothetical protein
MVRRLRTDATALCSLSVKGDACAEADDVVVDPAAVSARACWAMITVEVAKLRHPTVKSRRNLPDPLIVTSPRGDFSPRV